MLTSPRAVSVGPERLLAPSSIPVHHSTRRSSWCRVTPTREPVSVMRPEGPIVNSSCEGVRPERVGTMWLAHIIVSYHTASYQLTKNSTGCPHTGPSRPLTNSPPPRC